MYKVMSIYNIDAEAYQYERALEGKLVLMASAGTVLFVKLLSSYIMEASLADPN